MKAPDFLTQCKLAGLPLPEAEVKVVEGRRFRFDWCWPAYKVAFEQEGGVFQGGRHTRPTGYTRDCEKYNLAALEGYLLIRATTQQIASGQAMGWLEQALALRGWRRQ